MRGKGYECDPQPHKYKPKWAKEGDGKMEKFVPVMVKGGRKFQGAAYDIGADIRSNSFHLYGWSGRGGWVHTETIKLWSPTEGFVYCNPNYIEVRLADEEQVKADFAKYAEMYLNSTMAWCRSQKPNGTEQDIVRFAFNVIRKNHPELVPAFESKFSFKEDIGETIMSTIQWAMGLGYRSDKAVRIAYRALVKKGIVEKPEFTASWTMNLDLRGLGKYAARYVAA